MLCRVSSGRLYHSYFGGVKRNVLSTYSSAFSGSGVWTAFEFEITINNTTGAWHVRKDGATSDSFSASSLNTRGGTANNYANKIALGSSYQHKSKDRRFYLVHHKRSRAEYLDW